MTEELSVVSDPKPDLHGRSGTIMVARVYKNRGLTTSEEAADPEMIEVRALPREVPIARVRFGCKMTLNLGNYESVSLSVDIELPTPVEEVDDCYATAKEFVDLKLNSEVAALREHRSKSRA